MGDDSWEELQEVGLSYLGSSFLSTEQMERKKRIEAKLREWRERQISKKTKVVKGTFANLADALGVDDVLIDRIMEEGK